MDTLHFVEKGKFKNSLEKLCIYSGTIRNNQNKEESTTGANKMYDIIIQHENERRRHWTWACLPIHSLSKSHPSFPQVNIAPTPHRMYDIPTYQNTKILAQHTKSGYFILLMRYRNYTVAHNFQQNTKKENL